jgi:predicted Zn-dependent peptidase
MSATRTCRQPRFLHALACFTLLLVFTTSVRAQDRLAILTEAGTPMVAVEVLMAVGPLDEDPDHAGITYLAARSIIEPIRPVMDEIGAVLFAHSDKDAVGFTVLAAPDAWVEASRALLVALFRDPVDSLAVERERRAIRAELEGRVANPADVLAREVDRAFWGEEHPWGRPAVGTIDSTQRIRLRHVDDFLRENFVPARAYAVVVGPVDETEARDHLTRYLGTEAAFRPPFRHGLPMGLRLRREYNSITTWVSASYRFGGSVDLEALRMLTHLATGAVSFGPRRPTIYNARGDLFARPREGEIRFQIVVPPGVADEWAVRLQEEVARFTDDLLPAAEFAQALRSFRGSRTLELRSPEARAREAARQLFLTGSPSLLEDFDRLTPERLRNAARSLDSPIVLLLGPTPLDLAD